MKQYLRHILYGTLLLQAAVVVWLYCLPHAGKAHERALLAPLQQNTIDEIQLYDHKTEQLILKKQAEQWVLPAAQQFVAQQSKVETLLRKLLVEPRGWSIAETGDASERFKVESKNFERRLVLLNAGKMVAQVFFGVSPRYRNIYVRVEGASAIYELPFTEPELSVQVNAWLDYTYFYWDENALEEANLPNISIKRSQGTEYTLVPAIAADKLDRNKLAQLLYKLAHLTIEGFAPNEAVSALQQANSAPKYQYSIRLTQKEPVTYAVYEVKDKEYYLFKKVGTQQLFVVGKPVVDELLAAKAEQLVLSETKS
jgi:hypothetical protein